jgi:acyl-CoA synthetase (AMP-forming)/AMP-acid ligase II
LRFGGTVVLDDKFDPIRFAEMSRRYPITYTTLSSPMIPRLLELDENNTIDLSHLRVLSCGGAPLHQDDRTAFEDRFGVHLTQGYSSTEVLGAFVMELHGDAPVGAAGKVFSDRDDPIRIMKDDIGTAADVGQVGEIAFHRSCALQRYWTQQETGDSTFIGDEWYATGHIGRFDDDGYLYVLDRKKDVVIRGGFNIFSAEIERVLSSPVGGAGSRSRRGPE